MTERASTLQQRLEQLTLDSLNELYPDLAKTEDDAAGGDSDAESVDEVEVPTATSRMDTHERLFEFLSTYEQHAERTADSSQPKSSIRAEYTDIAASQGLSIWNKASLRMLRDIVQTKRPDDRTPSDIRAVAEMIGSLAFFHQAKDITPAFARQCNYKALKKGKYVFHQGDEGDTFFIILKGSANVIVNGAVRATLTKGDQFGELALLSNKPRAASILCVEDMECATLRRADYTRILLTVEKRKQFTRFTFLRKHPVLSSLPDETLRRLTDVSATKQFNTGHVICKEGDPKASHVFFIVSGNVAVLKKVKPAGKKDANKTLPERHFELYRLGPESYFGELAVLTGSPRQATIVCLESTQLICLPRSDFMRQITKEAVLKFNAAARKYPTLADIQATYNKVVEWENFKTGLVGAVVAEYEREKRQRGYPWSKTGVE
ncbi:cAMP/cGMP-dependent protein kinase [Carpediemonas membranifera]|uniref:cAMP/cGMP-dependent protein kinase n=1 Tax=Carpediemonas membranifera TaxID=201153 RepID=A0A8J6DZX4_9EUKA|nr:cAMP/cGMP-dependent protein kinase [Carpediemonas membranifera]|eukprot:KAG9391328.1 cAMP/cGMP-dependent protein kinase [Carpediemonas membranifera]